MHAREIEVFRPPCHFSSEIVSARACLDQDLSDLLPYLNATQEGAQYFPKGPFIRFKWEGHPVSVEPDKVHVGGFLDNAKARDAAGKVLELLSEVESSKHEIEPDHTPYNPPSIMEVFKLLPKKAGCKECGYETCMAFANALINGEAAPEDCPVLCGSREGQETLDKLREVLGL